jgi:hypothetical protein
MAILVCTLVLIGDAPERGMWGKAAEAATWTREYIRQLPDTAFASVEWTPDGKKARHLPHHDADGMLDVPHLCSALGRLHQVKWTEPGSAEAARRHLQQHLVELGRNPCRPVPHASP